MRKLWKVATIVGAGLIALPALVASPAGATPPTGYGFDGSPTVIVGAGSDTTYKVQLLLTRLYMETDGCKEIQAVGPTLNQCTLTGSPQPNTLGNWDRDTVAQAWAAGSSAGIASLNGYIPSGQSNTTYAGTVNQVPGYLGSSATGPNADFARSSRGPKTSGGNAIGGNELAVDTFWGFAQDGIEVASFNARGQFLQGRAGAGALTANELYRIWNCDFTQWSQVPSLGITPGSANDGPIVPWGMNPSSGTFASFQTYLINNGGAPSNWSPNGQACDRRLTGAGSGNQFPQENDVKPLLLDGPLSSSSSSVDNPENWIIWGSFGQYSAFPNKSSGTVSGTKYQSIAAPVNGVLPSTSGIINNTYPIGRTIYHVTRKQDADCPKTSSVCDFVGNPGPTLPSGTGTDFNVTGATGGVGGAVREYTRWICRASTAQHQPDNFTGVNVFTEITASINQAGFTTVPFSLRNSGSRCAVLS